MDTEDLRQETMELVEDLRLLRAKNPTLFQKENPTLNRSLKLLEQWLTV